MKEKTSPWFRVFALCTAIGLGGTYVWRQQQQAVPQINRPIERPVLPDSVNKDTPSPVEREKANRILLSGSKSSSGVFMPQTGQEPILMPGSKGGIIELKTGDTKERVIMPGSKSAIVIPQERTLLPSSKSIPMPVFRERRLTPEDQPKPVKP